MHSLKRLKLSQGLTQVKYLFSQSLDSNQTFRCFSVSPCANKGYLNNVTVIGAGHMGTGISFNAGLVGNNVIIADVNQSSLDRSRKKLEERLLKVTQRKLKGKSEEEIKSSVNKIMGQFQWTTDIPSAVSNADLVLESIPEQIELKWKLFAEIDKIAPAEAIFSTNTSSLPVHEIAQNLPTERKKNFGGTHFFDRDVKLVEVIRLEETTDQTYHKLCEWVTFINKVPIKAKDVPGFIVNRLGIPYMINAIRMAERGDATERDIDTAMKLGAGYPYGPFELMDHIGLDVIHDILKGFEKRYPGEEAYKCPDSLQRLYKEGKLGRKSGEGFHKY